MPLDEISDTNKQAREFTIRLNRCDPPDKANKLSSNVYPSAHEFDLLKRFKGIAQERILKQKLIIDKIRRRKFKYIDDVPYEALNALARHELKLLQTTHSEYEFRISQLREKIHQEMLGNCRTDSFQTTDKN